MGAFRTVPVTILRRPGIALVTLLFILLGAAFLTQVVPYRQIVDSQRQVSNAQERLSALETENQELQADVEALGTDAEIEKLAREKLGYVRPGETAYVVLDPPGSDDAPEVIVESELPEKTWVDNIWEFVTGDDLDRSG
jgi:cell division protein FtsL